MAQLNKFKNRDAPTSELLLVPKQHFHWVLYKIVKLLTETNLAPMYVKDTQEIYGDLC